MGQILETGVQVLGVKGAKVSRVKPGSIGDDLGIFPGDRITAINNQPICDILDYRYLVDDDQLEVEVHRSDGEIWVLEIEKDLEDTLGLDFDEIVYDRIKQCSNRCLFCFVDQLPDEVRSSLRVKDDDFRLSFLFGNFISMTNLRPGDWDKILGMRLSPLYISVHSTNPDTREYMFGNRKARSIMRDLKRLGLHNIEVHTQIVLCPDINDGDNLKRSVEELSSLWPTVQSIGIVPLGVTAFRDDLPSLRTVDSAMADQLIAQVDKWQEKFREETGSGLVYLADEFYVKAGKPFPAPGYYDDYPQIENGIGLSTSFLEELDEVLRELKFPKDEQEEVLSVCGVSAIPMFEAVQQRLEGTGFKLKMIPIDNKFFGGGVTVTGLVTGQDITAAMGNKYMGRTVLIPDVMLRDDRETFLDDMTISELASNIGARLKVIETDALSLLEALMQAGERCDAGGGGR